MTDRRHDMVNVGDVWLHVVSQGSGTPVVMLHGFLECWYGWRHQLSGLSAAGFRAIAPDQRGYNLSEKPTKIESYSVLRLVDDVVGLIDALGYDKVHLVGHDWGGVVAWYVADRHPSRVDKLVIVNGSHPTLLRERLRAPSQLLKSWYMFFFQLPVLPDRLVRSERFIRGAILGGSARRSAFEPEDIDQLVRAVQQPGAATGSLNWYRAMFRCERPAISRIEKPTLVIWGEQDQAMGVELLDGLDRLVHPLQVVRYPQASHWVQQEFPAEVNQQLIDFLRQP